MSFKTYFLLLMLFRLLFRSSDCGQGDATLKIDSFDTGTYDIVTVDRHHT